MKFDYVNYHGTNLYQFEIFYNKILNLIDYISFFDPMIHVEGD